MSEAYFLEFTFDPGNYYLAGRERIEGVEVLRIEYYPERLFSEERHRERRGEREPPDDARRSREREREREIEDEIHRQMNKTALVTLWVDPAAHQIVKYTFENVWLDFLPGAWLVRADFMRTSMTMGQPFPGVWLPRTLDLHAGATLASGSFEARYQRSYDEYRQAEVKTKLRVPKEEPEASAPPPDGAGPFVPDEEPPAPACGVRMQPDSGQPSSSPPPQPERIGEIRVHGNAFVAEADVIALAGIEVGQPLAPGTIEQVETRLRTSGRFESVAVRKRYRSLTDLSDVALLLVVHERPGVRTIDDDPGTVAGAWRRVRSRLMFLPILDYADGYGFTYGGRVSTVSLLGAGERLSVPLTWGGVRRAALEVERMFDTGPLTRIEGSFAVWQRENPHFRLDDRRVELRTRAERHAWRYVRTGVELAQSRVMFGGERDRLWTIGADAAFDTRGDPGFPRNAVLLGAGWSRLVVDDRDAIHRFRADGRGYLGVVGQAVVAGRVQYTAADRPLPPYERLLLGGSSTLRGFRAGSFAGDRLFVTSAELRLPVTSVLSSARLGVIAFFDAAKAYDLGQRMADVPWQRGVGGGVFLTAAVLKINLDVARAVGTGDTRVHLATGFSF